MANIDLTQVLDVTGLNAQVDSLVAAMADFSVPLAQFQVYHATETVRLFKNNAQGGTYRGVHWPYFKEPIRVRKTDGAQVDPFGETARMRAGRSNRKRDKGSRKRYAVWSSTGSESNLRAALRPSGMRLHRGDAILRDTSRLLQVLTTASDIDVRTSVSVTWGTGLEYAAKQHALRPVLVLFPGDDLVLVKLVLRHFYGPGAA